jgi:hypothetical protein
MDIQLNIHSNIHTFILFKIRYIYEFTNVNNRSL